MDWAEMHCIHEGLILLVAHYRAELQTKPWSENERSEISNDLAFAEILMHKYQTLIENPTEP